jgi:hypothetical protein
LTWWLIRPLWLTGRFTYLERFKLFLQPDHLFPLGFSHSVSQFLQRCPLSGRLRLQLRKMLSFKLRPLSLHLCPLLL